MRNRLTKHEQAAAGSLAQAIQQGQNQLAALGNVKVVICADHSESTITMDAEGRRSRHQVISEMLLALQAKHPQAILLIQFDSRAEVKLTGILDEPSGGTCGLPPLKMAHDLAGPDTEVWFLSDGELSESMFGLDGESMKEMEDLVRQFGPRIHFGFAGPKGDEGERTLRHLAKIAGTPFSTQIHQNMGGFTQQVEQTLLLAASSRK